MTQFHKTVFKNWLHEELSSLVSVQRCQFGHAPMAGNPIREPDLLVQMWAGVVIHIHIIDEPVPLKKVRRILESATENGIPALFILDARLLPQPNQRTDYGKWFIPLQSLMDDHAYSFRVEADQSLIQPVQFRPLNRYEALTVYGAPLVIKTLRHSRMSVKHQTLKGFWLLADLESEGTANTPPIRRTDYNTYQYTTPRPPSRDIPHREKPPPPETLADAAKNRLESGCELLGVTHDANRDEVKAAFRKLAFAVHPDVSVLPKPEAEARFKALSEAYAYIKLVRGWD